MGRHMKRKKKKRKSRRLRNADRRMNTPASEARVKRIKQKRDKKAKKRKKYRPRTMHDIIILNKKQLLREHTHVIGMTQVFHVAKFTFGYVVECESTDENRLLERETLFSRDGVIWTLLGRHRQGPAHHKMKWYPRDNIYPIGCKVRL